MRRTPTLLAVSALSLTVAACGSAANHPSASASKTVPAHASANSPTITIGSTNFPEQAIVANLYADALKQAGYKVNLRTGLGTRKAVEPALAAGALDLYPDYAGSLLIFLEPKDTAQATQLSTDLPALRKALAPHKATVLTPAPAIDTNVFAVTKATAAKYHLSTLSSLKPVAHQLVLGGPPECPTYAYCLPGLKRVYGLHFKSFVATDEAGPITIADLENGKVQVAELFSSDGSIVRNGFVQLADNKHLQPADHVIPVIRNSVKTPKVVKALDQLSAKLTTVQLEHLNIQVDVDHLDPSVVASAWFKAQRL